MDPFVAEIRIFPFNFAPFGWAMCNGQIMPIQQNTALFSLIGTYYGGNGTSNFALPNFQGVAPMNQGQGTGLSQRLLGETAGEQTVRLLSGQLPAHNHPATAAAARAVPLSALNRPCGCTAIVLSPSMKFHVSVPCTRH